ncbi:MAG TPA: glycine zipper 2TM domain-containing protein [Zoogloea sp.]|uniref:glycine zipper 2TM domain-containing protein n=1 Tax=Zoogloea sp. TaxID=49181 RepID=UPI002CD04432|nr:glycine zipper 2TM domain-containing protein [Zoogloea sp.]HMV17190.1 glycine zipper 2TM domain-containing protein [Rhodocyclaceae bacterium]HMV64181.1 glycine zipper 2TM domain-containing protein [Rhodocyclaceae bacterium]HMW51820.1 glycine zipper 2TM domain-containing protein [Rhodocyclaceae bacterium]HMY48584.1 glycine zipper 2TM domain-containing protein [Rhodocyclaceae bacterium]HMZ74881.1 glycine zipper 2TM domain-containing protein [Rhodocyclaceae bacterium]
MRLLPLSLALVAVVSVTGCASGLGGGTYERAEARRVMNVRMGVIESVRVVKLEGTKSPIGTLGGAAVGGIAGSTVGGGKGSSIGAVVGAVVGGLAGSAAEEGLTRKNGLEITLKMDNGEMLAIVQEDEGEGFKPGERVRLLQDGRTTRVTR